MNRISLTTLSLLFALGAAAYAQEDIVLSPESIVVNPVPSFEAQVFVDKDPSGNATPIYVIGEAIRVGVSVSEDAYIYLFNVRSDGSVDQILPNRYDDYGQDNLVRAGQTRFFPPEGASYQFTVSEPRGLDKVFVVASQNPLDVSTLASFERDPNFATSQLGQDGFAEGLSVIVRPLPRDAWVSDTALFFVDSSSAAAPAAPQYGTLAVTSSPSGARVRVDGVFAGYTPLRYGTTSGDHEIEIDTDGYYIYRDTVSVNAGQTRELSINLSRAARTGQAGFDSTPSGAQVYIDEQPIGTTPIASVELSEGPHRARFVLAGYSDTIMDFEVRAGAYKRVSAVMRAQQQQGSLEIIGNIGGAIVYLDGQQVGSLPNGSGRLTLDALSPGIHEVTVTAPGYSTFIGEVNVAAGQTTSLNVSLLAR